MAVYPFHLVITQSWATYV